MGGDRPVHLWPCLHAELCEVLLRSRRPRVLLELVFRPVRRVFDRSGEPAPVTHFVTIAGLLFGATAILGALAVPVTGWVDRAPEITGQIGEQLSDISE